MVAAQNSPLLLTTAQAGVLVGLKTNVVRQWVYRGVLNQAAGMDGAPLFRGRSPLYWTKDVLAAEKATRAKARREVPEPAVPADSAPVVDFSVDFTQTYWTVEEAAEAAQVTPNVVRNWKYRGRLAVAKTDWRGRPLFLAADVIRAERATREKARRVYPLHSAA